MSDLERQIRELRDIEEIRLLKARYFRFADEKRWSEWAELFAPDAVFVARTTGIEQKGREAIVAWARNGLGTAQSIHHGYMPEITVDGDRATGIWAMEDRVEFLDGTGFHGRGHYHEVYERNDGRWQIAHLRFTILRFEALPGGFPAWMQAMANADRR
jgi:uncharacterized protein (TIGR02246 family)